MMERRTWLKAFGAALSEHFLLSAQPQAQDAIQPRTFQLLEGSSTAGPSASVGIQDVQVFQENLYYLAFRGPTDVYKHQVGSVSNDGTALWRRALPVGMYSSVGVTDSGDVVVKRIDGFHGTPLNGIYTVGTSTDPATLSWIGTAGAGNERFIDSRRLGGVSRDRQTLEIRSIDGIRNGEPPSAFALPFPPKGTHEVLGLEDGTVAVLDCIYGLISELAPGTAAVRLHKPSNAAVRDSLARIDRRGHPSARPFATVYPASGATGAREISLLLAPFFRSTHTATLLQCDPAFGAARTLTVALESVHLAVPYRIVRIGEEVGIVYLNGYVDAYQV